MRLIQQKLIYSMIEKCNNYQKLNKIKQEINALLKVTLDNRLLHNLSIMKEDKINQERIDNSELNNTLTLEKSNNYYTQNMKDIKNKIKLQLDILMSVIAHKMDPIQRAGETTKSNKMDAKKFGRSSKINKEPAGLTKILFNIILKQIKLILDSDITNPKTINNQKNINTEITTPTQYSPDLTPQSVSQKNNQERSR